MILNIGLKITSCFGASRMGAEVDSNVVYWIFKKVENRGVICLWLFFTIFEISDLDEHIEGGRVCQDFRYHQNEPN